LGVTSLKNITLEELAGYIDWTPFFQTWELKGKYPALLSDPKKGEAARKLFEDAQELLQEIIRDDLIEARNVFGIFPANRKGDDILVFEDESRSRIVATLHTLRQQSKKASGKPNRALSDFVAPEGSPDYIGIFAVTAGHGVAEIAFKYEKEHDDYNAIMIKALADRLAEASAEYIHRHIRTIEWGYATDEQLSKEELIAERYAGIRPAPGYPAQPDHTEKKTIWKLLEAEASTGIQLTENLAMMPAASVCGIVFSHPEANYFNVGQLGQDQISDYAERKGYSLSEMETWLEPRLNYTPGKA